MSLIDANVLITWVVVEHEHHALAEAWFESQPEVWLCPAVEGALMRYLVRLGESAMTAGEVLRQWREHARVRFVPDDQPDAAVDGTAVRGYRQIADTYRVL